MFKLKKKPILAAQQFFVTFGSSYIDFHDRIVPVLNAALPEGPNPMLIFVPCAQKILHILWILWCYYLL